MTHQAVLSFFDFFSQPLHKDDDDSFERATIKIDDTIDFSKISEIKVFIPDMDKRPGFRSPSVSYVSKDSFQKEQMDKKQWIEKTERLISEKDELLRQLQNQEDQIQMLNFRVQMLDKMNSLFD